VTSQQKRATAPTAAPSNKAKILYLSGQGWSSFIADSLGNLLILCEAGAITSDRRFSAIRTIDALIRLRVDLGLIGGDRRG
jgi:hypothetical protein